VKVTDFGIGHAALPSGAPAGALGYLSPEQLRGDAVDHRSDIFSFGVLLYEMLARRRPYEGGSAQELVENMLHAEPPPPSEVNPHVPRALDALVKSMLAAQPAARMPGMPIVLRELQRLEEGLGLGSGASASEGARRDEAAASVPPPPAASRPARQASEPPRQAEPPRPASGPPRQAPRFPPHVELREERGFTAGPDLPPADAFQQRNRIADQEAIDYRRAMMQREWPERSSRSWPAIFAAIALVLAVLGIGMSGLMDDWPWLSERGLAATRLQETPGAAPAPSPPPAPLPLAEVTKEPVAPPAAPEPLPARPLALEAKPLTPEPAKPLTPEPAPLAQTERLVPRAPEEPASTGAGPAHPLPRAKEAPAKTAKTAKAPAQPPGATARVILAISPRGELYIDGKHHGATPPITTLDLEPGMHRIEVRNGSRKPFLTYLMVDPGDVRRIRHDFNAKPLRPPG
jgi:serine/threonine-protein kinase